MQMNSGIILAGQQPDFVNVLARSGRAAGQADAVRQQQKDFGQTNALRQLYQSQGAQIAAGDQNALNALAQFDPQAALGVQQSIASQGIAERGADMREQEFGMRVKEYAAGLSAQERAAEAEKIKTGVFSASAATSPEQWDQIVTQMGQPDLAGQFANKDALLRQYMTAAQILEADKGTQPNYKEIDGQYVDMNNPAAGAQGIPGYTSPPKSGTRMVVGPDGGVTFEQGVGVTGGGAPVGNSASSELDKSEIKARNALSRLDKISANLIENPDVISAQTLQGSIRATGLEWKDYITGNLNEADTAYLTEVTQQRGDILENMNFTIQEITGAAMGVEEAKRIGATMPNIDDSPTVFKAKLDRAMESTRMAVARYNYWRNNGLEGDPMGVAPLSGMKGFMSDRAAEVYKEEVATGDPATARDRTKAQLAKEFGIE